MWGVTSFQLNYIIFFLFHSMQIEHEHTKYDTLPCCFLVVRVLLLGHVISINIHLQLWVMCSASSRVEVAALLMTQR